MSNRFWLKLGKGDVIACMELMALHPKDVKANRLLKELNYCLRHIERTDREHNAIYGKRKNNIYKDNSFVNGLRHCLGLVGDDSKKIVAKEIEYFTNNPDYIIK